MHPGDPTVLGAEAGFVLCGPAPGSVKVITRSQLANADLSGARASIHNACLTALPAGSGPSLIDVIHAKGPCAIGFEKPVSNSPATEWAKRMWDRATREGGELG